MPLMRTVQALTIASLTKGIALGKRPTETFSYTLKFSAIFISITKTGRSNQPLIIHKVMINIHAQVLQSAKLKVDTGFRYTYENSRASSLLVEDLQISSGQLAVNFSNLFKISAAD